MESNVSKICEICQKVVVCGKDGRTLGSKAVSTLTQWSVKYRDQINENIGDQREIAVHNICYRTYTNRKAFAQKQADAHKPQSTASRLRRTTYDYKTHCLICGEEINLENFKQHPKRFSSIGNVEIVDKKQKRSLLQDTLIAECEKRTDDISIQVKSRILCAGDIRAVEATYHRDCLQRFLSNRTIKSDQVGESSGSMLNSRNSDSWKEEAFKKLCL